MNSTSDILAGLCISGQLEKMSDEELEKAKKILAQIKSKIPVVDARKKDSWTQDDTLVNIIEYILDLKKTNCKLLKAKSSTKSGEESYEVVIK